MTNRITLQKALKLVTFYQNADGTWCVDDVHGNVLGNIEGEVYCNVWGSVHGNVDGDVKGDVVGNVKGTIAGQNWASIETPKQYFRRLLNEKGDQELIDAFNQLEDN